MTVKQLQEKFAKMLQKFPEAKDYHIVELEAGGDGEEDHEVMIGEDYVFLRSHWKF